MHDATSPHPARAAVQQTAVLVLAVVGLALLAIRLADVLMMAFGAVLVAVLLHALARPLHREDVRAEIRAAIRDELTTAGVGRGLANDHLPNRLWPSATPMKATRRAAS